MTRLYPILLVLLSLACLKPAGAQDSTDYHTLQSALHIPSDFIEKSSVKYQQDLETKVSGDDKRFTRKSKESFYLKSNFNINRFLTSGKVLFNDEVSVYLGQVLDELLKDDQALRGKIRVYTVKSAAVNAYTTENGIIFVNLGLLARMQSEAQLAYVLAHEVIHFKEKHVINGYVKAQEISAAKGDYRKLSFDEKTFTKSSFDKEQELEADQLGLKIFLRSGYDRKAMEQVFDILKFADFPDQERVFKKEYLEGGAYKFPDHYYLANVKKNAAEEDYDDSKRSHPNIKKRKESINAGLSYENEKAEGGKKFLVSKEKFEAVKQISLFELSRSYLLNGEIIDAFLHAYTVQKNFPDSRYLQKNILKALYSLARFGHSGNPDNESGERQRILYFLKDFNETEFFALAIRKLYLYHEDHPKDEEIRYMLLDLMFEVAVKDEHFENRFMKFGNEPKEPLKDQARAYVKHAFTGFKDEAAFFTFLEEKCSKARSYEEERKRNKKKKKKKEDKTPIMKTVVVNPFYVKVDSRKKEQMRYEDAEAILSRMDPKVKNAADILGMETTILNTLNFTARDVEKFNNHSIVQEWLIEKLRQDSPTGISPIHNEMKAISEAYGTPYFTWMGGVALTDKQPFRLSTLFYSVLYPPSAPLWLYLNFKPQKNAFYFSYTFDVRNEGVVEGEMRRIKMRDNESLLQSNVYYTLFKLKNQ